MKRSIFLGVVAAALFSNVSFAGPLSPCQAGELNWDALQISAERRIDLFLSEGLEAESEQLVGAIVLKEGSKTELQSIFLCGAGEAQYRVEDSIQYWVSEVGEVVNGYIHNDDAEVTMKIKTLKREAASALVEIVMSVEDEIYGDFKSTVFARLPIQ